MDVPLPSDAELEKAPLLVRSCISHNKTMQEAMDILFANHKIPPPYTRAVWKALESEIPEVFEAYYARMNLLFPNHNHNNNNNPDIYNSMDNYMNENQQVQWFDFVDWVIRCIQDSMELNMTKLATITSIHTVHKVLPVVTRAVWKVLEEYNPQLFQDYYARLQQHHNGAMHNQNGGELVAPNDAENDVEHQNQQPQGNIEYGGELELMNQHLQNGEQNGMHNQNGGELVAPNAAAQNGIHNQNGGELVAPNAAQNGRHHPNDQNQQPQENIGNVLIKLILDGIHIFPPILNLISK